MSKIIAKYRKEAEDYFRGSYLHSHVTTRNAILESIFRPEMKVPDGKGPMTHLHPDSHKLHLPHGCHLADWRKYKVEDHPALVNHQKRCHAAGLHDPWLRNYAFTQYPNMNLHKSRIAIVTTGLGYGFCIALGIYLAEKIYDQFYPTVYRHSKEYVEKYGTKEVFH